MGYERYAAKKTYYDGTWYDSNLEAKVAEALDDIGVVYEYHRQCFRDRRFPYGQYTPDFHLPNDDAYIEVCGVFDERHEGNVRVLCEILGATPDDASRVARVMTIGGRNGFTMGHCVSAGRLRSQPVLWSHDGRESSDLLWLTGVV